MHGPSFASRSVSVLPMLGLIGMALSPGCGRTESLPADDPSRLTIKLTSSAFTEGEMIPKTFTCDGADHSPPLEWSGVPSAGPLAGAHLRRPRCTDGHLVALGHLQPAP